MAAALLATEIARCNRILAGVKLAFGPQFQGPDLADFSRPTAIRSLRAAAAAPRAPQTTAPFRNVGQNRGLRKILLENIVHSKSKNIPHTENYFLHCAWKL